MSVPIEVKAQGQAMLIFGYSSRRVKQELHRMFPQEQIPNHASINKWRYDRSMNHGRAASHRWFVLSNRVAEIILERLDETRSMPLLEAVKVHERILERALGFL